MQALLRNQLEMVVGGANEDELENFHPNYRRKLFVCSLAIAAERMILFNEAIPFNVRPLVGRCVRRCVRRCVEHPIPEHPIPRHLILGHPMGL